MPIVTWRDEYNINVEQLDRQHQEMLEIVNKLHAAVEAREHKSVLRDMLVELAEFTRVHFSTEEELMKEYSFPDFQDHQIQHRLLLQHLNDLAAAVSIVMHLVYFAPALIFGLYYFVRGDISVERMRRLLSSDHTAPEKA